MARGVMYVYVNDKCIRKYGDTRRYILNFTKWHNNASYEELKKYYKWLKEDDILTASYKIKKK